MTIPQPLTPTKLYRCCDPAKFTFQTTADLHDSDHIIGQPRAIEAIQFGIGIQHQGFNLFVLGPNGIGKHTAVRKFLTQKAAAEPPPSDWCYVNNFSQPHRPHALQLPAGQGTALHNHMERLVDDLFTVIPAALSSEAYESQKRTILTELKEREAEALKSLEEQAHKQNIGFIRTPSGFAFAPLQNGEVISPEQFLKLTLAEQEDIETRIGELQETLQKVMHQLPQWQREIQEKLKALQEETAVFTIHPLFQELQQTYQTLPAVLTFLQAVQKDIIANVTAFVETDDNALGMMGGITATAPRPKAIANRYQVNVIVDHSQTTGAPVIFEDLPTYQNLIGRVEHVSQMGNLLTDFTLIKSGALHHANSGYLILDARQLLLQPYAWEGLKHALRLAQIKIESLGQIYSWISTVSLEPEPVPLQVKVILLGDRLLYYLLCRHDPDFLELFKVSADFEDEMERSDENDLAYAHLIAGLAQKERLRPFSPTAVARIIEHSARLAGDAERLTTHMQSISDLLREADYWAGHEVHEVVTAVDVQRALDAQTYRASRIHERIQENMLRHTILIDTDGTVIGQINGLSVIMLDRTSFGQPSRITACVRLGKGEVIDIERQVELGGPLHSKGVLILAGFLGARYAAERPLSLSATLVFEQSYGGVDGDSASSAELYALLSALAELPLKQALAVTGSVNQRGQVQAIGGVNEKIEGFFDLCQARGLTGAQGVLIPAANVKNLMLRQDVVTAVAHNQFHIYPITTIDEGIELLTGIPAGDLNDNGEYPAESVNGRIITRLATLAEKARAFAQPPANNGHVPEKAKA
ncbi:MAG: AAA family ATPase [Ardenticatenaceae bacterium]|nr:AAA family ATPase [Ardenticatenaceae bacterium]